MVQNSTFKPAIRYSGLMIINQLLSMRTFLIRVFFWVQVLNNNAGSGYGAPEVDMSGQCTLKSDVYSFGVVMLELLTGRKPFDG